MPPFWGVSAAMAPPAAIARASPAPSKIANLEITLFILCSLFSVIFQIFLFLVEAVTLGHHCSALRPAHADPDQSSCRYNIEIGRAHVGTPVTNAHLVCRLLLEQKK